MGWLLFYEYYYFLSTNSCLLKIKDLSVKFADFARLELNIRFFITKDLFMMKLVSIVNTAMSVVTSGPSTFSHFIKIHILHLDEDGTL